MIRNTDMLTDIREKEFAGKSEEEILKTPSLQRSYHFWGS